MGIVADIADPAFNAGFRAGLYGTAARGPATYTAAEARSFEAGYHAGQLEWDARLDVMYADDPADDGPRETDLYPPGAWT